MNMVRSSIFTREVAGLPVSFIDIVKQPYNIFFVDSSNSNAGDTDGHGSSPDIPFATIDYAIGKTTANKGDIIYVMPGHAENGISITCDINNIKIVGIGEGTKRPTLTFSVTNNKITISADNVTLENILLLSGIDSIVNKITVSGNNCSIKKCELKDVTDIETITDIIVTGDNCLIKECFKNGYTAGNANDVVVKGTGANNLKIEDCDFYTKVATGIVEFETTACKNVMFRNCNFLATGVTDLSDNVVDTVTGSVWGVDISCFDIGAGANFSGGSGNALAILPRT